LPPLFFLLGERVNALSVGNWRRVATGTRGGWYRLAHLEMRRPVPVAIAASAVLIVASLPFLHIRFTGVDASVLPPSASSRIVDEALQRDFPVALTTPVYAVVRGTRADAGRWATGVRALPEVRAMSNPVRLA